MAELLPDGTRRISISRQQFAEINGVLRDFYRRTRCGAAVLTDASGLLLARSGSMKSDAFALLAALAAADYAATREMARIVGEPSGFKVHFHEGESNSIYLTGVGEERFLLVVFDQSTTFGMVRVLAEKSAEQLLEILGAEREDNAGDGEPEPQVAVTEDFREELSSRLDSLLKGG